MHVAIVEPFYTGSHKYWVDKLEQHLDCTVSRFTLPGRFWKWRMAMGAVDLAQQVNESGQQIDVFLVTDMLDASLFKALLSPSYQHLPLVLYMHENQVVYPFQTPLEHQNWDRHYGVINIKSTLVADQVWFNSIFHKQAFLSEAVPFLNAFPDNTGLIKAMEAVAAKCDVVPLGVELDQLKPTSPKPKKHTILWNHRWEFDKNPKDFFHALRNLSKKGVDFDLIVCGEAFEKHPVVFNHARVELEKHIIHWGYAESKQAYFELLQQSTLLPVTSKQEFFGLSVMEAVACQVRPILPNRLSYPELYGPMNAVFYEDFMGLEKALEIALKQPVAAFDGTYLNQYAWEQVVEGYRQKLSKLVS